MKKIILLILFTLFLIFGFNLPVKAEEKLPSVDELFKKMGEVNPGLKDYSSDIKVELKLTIRALNFEGKYYYKKPDKYKLELKKSPTFLKKYPQIFGWCLPDPSEHNCTVKLVKDEQEQYFYEVELIPIQGRGDLIKQILWIDKDNYTFPKQLYLYNYGSITVNAKYRKEGKFLLFDNLNAAFDIKIPILGSIKATANAVYNNYKTNINLPDSFFTTTDKKK